MPACLLCTFTRKCATGPSTKVISSDVFRTLLSSSKVCPRSSQTRLASSSSTSNDQPSSSKHEPLTLLHRTTNLLPRVLPARSDTTNYVESLEFWNELLSDAYDSIVFTGETDASVVVYGVDGWSGAQELITALLEEPFASDHAQNEVIRSRWNDNVESSIKISTTKPSKYTQTKGTTIHITSSYLQQFPTPIEITEIRPPPPLAAQDSLSTSHPAHIRANDDAITALFRTDIPIILCNPLTTPLPILLDSLLPKHNSNLTIILTSTPPTTDLASYTSSIISRSLLSESEVQPKLLFVDPSRAILALRTLEANPSSPTGIQRYQDGFIGSQISTFTSTLQYIFAANPSVAFKRQTAVVHLSGALSACRSSLNQAKLEIDAVCSRVSELEDKIAEMRAKLHGKVFNIPGNTAPKVDGDIIAAALEDAEREIKIVMDRLTWWRMVWHADEISTIIGGAIARSWCKDLENQLILHTGYLTTLQQTFTASTFTALSSFRTPSVFTSPILHNNLLQITHSPSYTLTPLTLTSPIHARRTQLIQFPTTRLHLAAQKCVLGMGGSVAAGVGLGWAGWIGWLLPTGEGLLGFIGVDPGTAIGVGILGSLLGVRWGVGKWEKAKKVWWDDWRRVGDGLDRDLKSTLDRTVEEKVVVVPETASAQLLELVKQRKEEVGQIEDEVDSLQQDLRSLRA